ALALAEALEIPAAAPRESPCGACAARPCLTACPVGAFSPGGYDVPRCAAHLRSGEGRACMEGGCLARRACPIGVAFAPGEEQARFHMQAFLAAREGAVQQALCERSQGLYS